MLTTSNDISVVCANIKRLRTERNLKQANIASALEVCQSFYSEIEGGKRTITLNFLYDLAKFYEVEITEFLVDNSTPH